MLLGRKQQTNLELTTRAVITFSGMFHLVFDHGCVWSEVCSLILCLGVGAEVPVEASVVYMLVKDLTYSRLPALLVTTGAARLQGGFNHHMLLILSP